MNETSHDHTTQPQNQLVHTRKSLVVNDNQFTNGMFYHIDFPSLNGEVVRHTDNDFYFASNYDLDYYPATSNNATHYAGYNGRFRFVGNYFYLHIYDYSGTSIEELNFNINGDVWNLGFNYNRITNFDFYYNGSASAYRFLSYFVPYGIVSALDYTNYNLSYNWSPYAYFNNNSGLVSLNSSNTFERVILINDGRFTINNIVYNTLEINCFKAEGGALKLQDGSIVSPYTGADYYINMVLASNSYTSQSVILTSVDTEYFTTSNNGTGLCIVLGSFSWSDINLANIRLFNFNLSNVGYFQNYNNGNVLNLTTSYNYVGTNSTTNPITLLTGAFNGLKDIFSISLLPGISLGILFFLPLVVSIIVLIFKAVKK